MGGTLATQQTDWKWRVKNVTWGPENISCQPGTQSFKNMDYSISVGSKQRGKVRAVAPVQNTISDKTAKRTREWRQIASKSQFCKKSQSGPVSFFWIQKATDSVKWPLHIPDRRQGSRNNLRFDDYWGSGPIIAVLQCQANPWKSRSKLLNFLPWQKSV